MSAFAIFILEAVYDHELLDQYRVAGRATIPLFGGRPRVTPRSTKSIVEGPAEDVVMIEFESLAQARAWYESPEYREASEIRKRACRCQVILTESL